MGTRTKECKTFAQELMQPLQMSRYCIAPRKPKTIKGELGFVFSKTEVEYVMEDMKHALVLNFLSKRPLIDVLTSQIIKS